MKNTKKKWYSIKSGDGKFTEIFGDSNELYEPVCVVPHDDVTVKGEKEVKKNIKLILAAPALLNALESALKHVAEIGDFEHEQWIKETEILLKSVRGNSAK